MISVSSPIHPRPRLTTMIPRSPLPPLPAAEAVIKSTTSRCPTCHKPVPAQVVRRGYGHGQIHLHRQCPQHGETSACIASDARFYWVSMGSRQGAAQDSSARCGCPDGACRASDGSPAGTLGRNASPAPGADCEQLSTCLCLIEVVNSCNLACPTCYADSPVGQDGRVDAPSLENLQGRIQSVIDRKGKIEILQLSGGEPTLHPQFFGLLAWTMSNPGIEYVLLNTNGLRIAHEPDFAARLGEVAKRGKFQLYLQFDGPGEAGQRDLRGADLRKTRSLCLQACAELGIGVTLAMTVTEKNLDQLWASIEFGLAWANVRGVSFQPRFLSGRVGTTPPSTRRCLGVADIVLGAVAQSGGRLRLDDFTPLPCGDPNCATIGYLLKVDDQVRSISDFIDFTAVQGFLRDRVRYQLSDLAQCGCESEPLGALLKQFELDETHTFRLFIKPFMDDWTWDEDRVDRCCTHVIRTDGQLDSFCRHYAARHSPGMAE